MKFPQETDNVDRKNCYLTDFLILKRRAKIKPWQWVVRSCRIPYVDNRYIHIRLNNATSTCIVDVSGKWTMTRAFELITYCIRSRSGSSKVKAKQQANVEINIGHRSIIWNISATTEFVFFRDRLQTNKYANETLHAEHHRPIHTPRYLTGISRWKSYNSSVVQNSFCCWSQYRIQVSAKVIFEVSCNYVLSHYDVVVWFRTRRTSSLIQCVLVVFFEAKLSTESEHISWWSDRTTEVRFTTGE
jgi:hypothetical protein